jgi:glycosyltransferase involved in cell wall biosynthesis
MINNKYLLTAIVPVSAMANKLQNFKFWVDKSPAELKIIVVHDWRDSATGDELKQIIEGKVNIELIEGKFGSPGAARNAGLERVDTVWTVFWDSDDLPEPYRVIELLNKQKTNSQIIITSFRIQSLLTQKIIRVSTCPKGSTKRQLNYLANDPGIWRVIFRTELIRNLKFSKLKMGEDVLFLAAALDAGSEPIFLNEITYTYFRDVPNQLTEDNRYVADLYTFLRLLDSKYKQNRIEAYFVVPLAVKQTFSLIKHRGLNIQNMKVFSEIRVYRKHFLIFSVSVMLLISTRLQEKILLITRGYAAKRKK